MRDCTRYTINAALHVVTCTIMDAIPDMSESERRIALDSVAVIGELRETWILKGRENIKAELAVMESKVRALKAQGR